MSNFRLSLLSLMLLVVNVYSDLNSTTDPAPGSFTIFNNCDYSFQVNPATNPDSFKDDKVFGSKYTLSPVQPFFLQPGQSYIHSQYYKSTGGGWSIKTLSGRYWSEYCPFTDQELQTSEEVNLEYNYGAADSKLYWDASLVPDKDPNKPDGGRACHNFIFEFSNDCGGHMATHAYNQWNDDTANAQYPANCDILVTFCPTTKWGFEWVPLDATIFPQGSTFNDAATLPPPRSYDPVHTLTPTTGPAPPLGGNKFIPTSVPPVIYAGYLNNPQPNNPKNVMRLQQDATPAQTTSSPQPTGTPNVPVALGLPSPLTPTTSLPIALGIHPPLTGSQPPSSSAPCTSSPTPSPPPSSSLGPSSSVAAGPLPKDDGGFVYVTATTKVLDVVVITQNPAQAVLTGNNHRREVPSTFLKLYR